MARGLIWVELAFFAVFLAILVSFVLDPDFRSDLTVIESIAMVFGTIYASWGLAQAIRHLPNQPIILECRPSGIMWTSRNRFISWEEMDYIDSNPFFGWMTFHMPDTDNVSVTPFAVGYRQTKLAIEYVRKTAPKHLTREL